jgi:tetratricopeptide (TPR) repeat protein
MAHESLGNHDQAEQLFKRAIDLHSRLGAAGDVARVENNLALLYLAAGRLDDAEKRLTSALEANIGINNPASVAMNRANLGRVSMARRNWPEAEMHVRAAKEIVDELRDPYGMAIVQSYLATILEQRGGLALAEEAWRECVTRYRRSKNLFQIVHGLERLADVLLQRGQVADAVLECERAIKIVPKGRDGERLRASLLCTWGRCLVELGELSVSRAKLDEALSVAIASGAVAELSTAYTCLGGLYLEMEQYDETEKMFRSALAIDEQKSSLRVPSDLANIASALLSLGRTDEAEELMRQADEKATYDHLGWKMNAELRWAGLEMKRDQFESAEERIQESLRVERERGAMLAVGRQLSSLGLLYGKWGRRTRREHLLKKR